MHVCWKNGPQNKRNQNAKINLIFQICCLCERNDTGNALKNDWPNLHSFPFLTLSKNCQFCFPFDLSDIFSANARRANINLFVCAPMPHRLYIHKDRIKITFSNHASFLFITISNETHTLWRRCQKWNTRGKDGRRLIVSKLRLHFVISRDQID